MGEWIRCDERLPEDNVKVLLYTPRDDTIRIGWHVHQAWPYCREWALITAMNSHQTLTKKPSHWMYLPEKPRGVDHGESQV